MGMIPHNAELTAKWKAEPFVLLGINSDKGSRDDLAQKFSESKIEYPNILVGNTDAEIPTEWGVRGWPTLVVLDQQGVIRYRGHGGPSAEKKCEELLGKDTEPGPGKDAPKDQGKPKG